VYLLRIQRKIKAIQPTLTNVCAKTILIKRHRGKDRKLLGNTVLYNP